jgi:pantoate--beta-alanine ligase
MEHAESVAAIRSMVDEWKREGARVAFVPTMGNLHAGHLELVKRARAAAERVVASIFVNPMQFGAGEDFEAYPRTLTADARQLEETGADALFAPSVDEMYHRPPAEQTRVEVPGISDILCGASRPGHFSGVATVVCKLFNQVRPDVAVFGEKDFQQLLVIRRMVQDLDISVEILGHPTQREPDGLARSSRNRYLSDHERGVAPVLYGTLERVAGEIAAGRRDFDAVESEARERLDAAGFVTDYVSIRRAQDLATPAGHENEAIVVLAAARLGRARLIDNIKLASPAG